MPHAEEMKVRKAAEEVSAAMQVKSETKGNTKHSSEARGRAALVCRSLPANP